MEITHIPAGSRSADDIDEILAEAVDFDTCVSRASGLGPDFDPRSDEVRQELLAPNAYVTHETWICRLGGVIVAKGIAYLTLQDNLEVADTWCSVHPERRRHGLGAELLAAMETSLVERGRTQLTSYCELPSSVRDAHLRSPHLAAESGAGGLPVGHPEVAFLIRQGSTLVAAEQRGHSLGTALKIANHVALGERTSIERVYTWNAVENSRMLVINDQAGFTTWAWVGLWKKCLA